MRTRGQKEVETCDETVYLTFPFLWVQIWRKCSFFLFWLCWKNTEVTVFCSCCLFGLWKWTRWQSKIGQPRPWGHLPAFVSVPKQHEWAPNLSSAPDGGAWQRSLTGGVVYGRSRADPSSRPGLWDRPRWLEPCGEHTRALVGVLGSRGSKGEAKHHEGSLVLIKLRQKKRYKLTSLTGQVSSSQWDLPWPSCATS